MHALLHLQAGPLVIHLEGGFSNRVAFCVLLLSAAFAVGLWLCREGLFGVTVKALFGSGASFESLWEGLTGSPP